MEISSDNNIVNFGIQISVGRESWIYLEREIKTVSFLNKISKKRYLPLIFLCNLRKVTHAKKEDLIGLSLIEWFENYHEWHLSVTENNRVLMIWDHNTGIRPALPKEISTIFKESSKILTSFYDINTYKQIFKWHHGAGDFVINTTKDPPRVKLTTARDYKETYHLMNTSVQMKITGLLLFFLDICARMRIDRENGAGDLIWNKEDIIFPIIDGFIKGLEEKNPINLGKIRGIREFIKLLKSFNPPELEVLYFHIINTMKKDLKEEANLIERHLKEHTYQLYRIIQSILL